MANIKLKLVDPKTCEIAEKGGLGMFINGNLITTYHTDSIPEQFRIIENMLSTAFECGKKERSAEIRKLIN